MSKLTPNLGLHIWEKPKDNKEKFNYIKSIAENFEKVDTGFGEAVDKFTEPLAYKGEVETYKDLPNENNKNGDIYNVTSENKNYIWNGTEWVEYSSTLDLTYLEDNTKTLQTTEIAEELEIKNCAGANANIDIVSGKSWQETRDGKNLLNYNNTYSHLFSNYDAFVISVPEYTLKASKTYYFSVDAQILNEGTAESIKFVPQTSISYSWSRITSPTLNKDIQRYVFSIIANEDIVSSQIALQSSNASSNCSIQFTNFMISTENAPYEPYGVMPSPDFPSEIRNVGDNVNYFDKNSVKFYNNNAEDFGVTTNGSPTRVKTSEFEIPGGKRYVVSGLEEVVLISVRQYDENKTIIYSNLIITNNSFTLDKKTKYIHLLMANKNNTTNISSEDVSKKNIKIEEGSIPTPYTPYGCGSIDFKVENKNIINLQKYFEGNNVNGCTKELLGNIIRLKFGAGADAFIGHVVEQGRVPSQHGMSELIEIKSHIKYILSMSSSPKCYITFFTEDFVSLGYYTIPSNYNKCKFEFTTPVGTKYFALRIGIQNNNYTQYDFTDIQLIEYENYKENEIVPHQEQIVSFPLSKGQVLHKVDYLASNGIHQKSETIVLNGDENIRMNTNKTFFTIEKDMNLFDTSATAVNEALSNYGLATTFSLDNSTSLGKFSYNKTIIYLGCGGSKIQTEEQLKSQLNTEPMKIEAKLAKEKIIPYTPEQQEAYNKLQNLLLYEGYTKITCLDEMKPDIQATYYFDNEINNTYAKRINSIEENVRQIENNIKRNVQSPASVKFKSLEDGEEINSNSIIVDKDGYYIVNFQVNMCGASRITKYNASYIVRLSVNGKYIGINDIGLNDDTINMPISNVWNYTNSMVVFAELHKGDTVFAKFKNNTGIATDSEYNSGINFKIIRISD